MNRQKGFAKSFLFLEDCMKAMSMEQNEEPKTFFKNKEILVLEDDSFLAKRLAAKFEKLEVG